MMFAFVVFVLAGCGEKKEVYAPVAINEGTDRCEVCHMLISDDHNATQLILNDGRALKFDDIGCMFDWVNENGLENVNVRYVRDYYSKAWIKIEEATFVYDKDFRTPMAYGVYSFQAKYDAEKFIEEEGKGTLLSYEELENHSWEQNMELMNGHDHTHEHETAESEEHDMHDMEHNHNHE